MHEINVYKDHIDNPILEVQYYLREISLNRPEITLINSTGIYDDDTRKAVTSFQNLLGLNATGIVDIYTWNAIVNEYLKYYNINKSPNPICFCPAGTMDINLGDTGNAVYIVQLILKRLGQIYKNYNDINVNGVFDEITSYVVKQFQHCSDMPATGTVNKETWNALTKINDVFWFNQNK